MKVKVFAGPSANVPCRVPRLVVSTLLAVIGERIGIALVDAHVASLGKRIRPGGIDVGHRVEGHRRLVLQPEDEVDVRLGLGDAQRVDVLGDDAGAVQVSRVPRLPEFVQVNRPVFGLIDRPGGLV